jgi:hypothetical protein
LDYPGALQHGQSGVCVDQLHDFRGILQWQEIRLVHSQKNHGLAYDFADWLLQQTCQNKCSLLFFKGMLICIKNIQNNTAAFVEAIRKLRALVAHNFIHRKCAQLFCKIDRAGRSRPD